MLDSKVNVLYYQRHKNIRTLGTKVLSCVEINDSVDNTQIFAMLSAASILMTGLAVSLKLSMLL